MTSRRTVLRVESLDERALPSAVASAAPAAAALAAAQPQPPSGQAHGTYAVQVGNPDAGTAYHVQGSGHVKGVGQFTFTGTLHRVGFIAQGHATGTLTLTNANGSVTLALTGPTQAGFARLPVTFAYHVSGGTGAYAHATGHAFLNLYLTPTPGGDGSHGTVLINF